MFCRFCGHEMPDDSVFCPKCGKAQEEERAAEEKRRSISFDDELEGVGLSEGDDDEDDPDVPDMEPVHDTERMMSENGHCNTQICLEGGTRGTLYAIDGQSLSLLAGQLSGGGSEIIVDEPVQSFKLGAARRHIFYTTPKGAFYTRWPDGRRQMIAGANGDTVMDYCLNKDYLFVLLRGGNGSGIIYQLDQKRLEPKIIRSQGRIKSRIGADDKYLYYILQSEDVNKSGLVQYDIAAGTERVIFSHVGIHEISCYRSYVLASTYKNFMSKTNGVELILIDPAAMKYRKLADVSADQINCCLDHAFYVDQNTQKLWMVPLIPGAGKPQLVWDRPVAHHEVCMAILHIWGPNDQDPHRLPLIGDNAFQAKDQSMSKEEQDSLRYNPILVETPEFYRDMNLDRALGHVMAEHDFDEEVFDYVVFLTKPQFNKHKEDVNALLAAANYPAQRKPGSEPILFVDGSLFHTRSKGFVVATDGIYTRSKGFILFNQSFTCEENGIQNLDACLWRNDRYDDSPQRTLKLAVALSRSKLDEVAGLVELVFVFSYFRRMPFQVDYTFPTPAKKVPPYITLETITPTPKAETASTGQKPPQTFPSKNRMDDKW